MVIEVSREVSVMSPGTKEFIDVEREMNIESRKRNVQEKINRRRGNLFFIALLY